MKIASLAATSLLLLVFQSVPGQGFSTAHSLLSSRGLSNDHRVVNKNCGNIVQYYPPINGALVGSTAMAASDSPLALKKENIPNILTACRVAAIPMFIASFVMKMVLTAYITINQSYWIFSVNFRLGLLFYVAHQRICFTKCCVPRKLPRSSYILSQRLRTTWMAT